MGWTKLNYGEGYEINAEGQVRSHKGGNTKLLKENHSGPYSRVKLYVNNKGKYFYIHRLVAEHFLKDWDQHLEVDHIDRNKRNNNCSNLRMVTKSQNQQNRSANIYFHKRDKLWYAQIVENNKKTYLGCYKEKADALAAYQRARKERNKWEELKNVV